MIKYPYYRSNFDENMLRNISKLAVEAAQRKIPAIGNKHVRGAGKQYLYHSMYKNAALILLRKNLTAQEILDMQHLSFLSSLLQDSSNPQLEKDWEMLNIKYQAIVQDSSKDKPLFDPFAKNAIDVIKQHVIDAAKLGVGNCGELARAAFMFCLEFNPPEDLEDMQVALVAVYHPDPKKNIDHEFVLLGENLDEIQIKNFIDPRLPNPECVFCDPWLTYAENSLRYLKNSLKVDGTNCEIIITANIGAKAEYKTVQNKDHTPAAKRQKLNM